MSFLLPDAEYSFSAFENLLFSIYPLLRACSMKQPYTIFP